MNKCLSGSMCLFWLNCLFTEYTVRVLLFSTALTFWSLWLFDPADASGGLLISWKKKKTTSSFLIKDVLFQKICSWNPTKAWWQGKSRISDQVLNPGNRGFSYLRSFYDLINMAISNPFRNLWLTSSQNFGLDGKSWSINQECVLCIAKWTSL